MRKQTFRRPSPADIDDGGCAGSRPNPFGRARRHDHLHRPAGGVAQQITMRRSVARRHVLHPVHRNRQRAGFARLARRLPRLDAAADAGPVFGYLHAAPGSCFGGYRFDRALRRFVVETAGRLAVARRCGLRGDFGAAPPAHLTPMVTVMLAALAPMPVMVTQESSFPYDLVFGLVVFVSAAFFDVPGYGSPASPRLAPSRSWFRPSASSSFTSGWFSSSLLPMVSST